MWNRSNTRKAATSSSDSVVVETENRRSPAVRWWTQAQALCAFEEAGFASVKATGRDTFERADPGENLFKVWGTRP